MKTKSLSLIMGIAFVFIFLASQVSAADIYQNTTAAGINATSVTGLGYGIIINTGISGLSITNVSAFPGSGATSINITYENGTGIATSAVSSLNASFSNVTIDPYKNIKIFCLGGSVLMYMSPVSFPIINSYINVSSGAYYGGNLSNQWNCVAAVYISTGAAPGSVTLNSPANSSNKIVPVQFNATVAPAAGLNLTNATLTIWNATSGAFYGNSTTSLSGSSSTSALFTNSTLSLGNWTYNVRGCWGNAQPGNCTYDSSNHTFQILKIVENSQSYNNPVLGGSSQIFYINLSVGSAYQISTISLMYNGTTYGGSFSSLGNNIWQGTSSVTLSNANANKSFYWNVLLNDGSRFNSTINNQTINQILIGDCSSYTNRLYNLSVLDEDLGTNLSMINLSISLNLFNANRSENILNYSALSNSNPSLICFNYPVMNSTYSLDAQFQYSNVTNYVTRYYNIFNYTISNTTLNQNISLYDLLSSEAQVFTIFVRDSKFLALPNALIEVYRKYVSTGTYKIVEIPKTDANGKTTSYLIVNNVIYNFVIKQNGVIVKTFNDVKAICQTPGISECIIDFNSFSSGVYVPDYSTMGDLNYTLGYNATTRAIVSQFTILSGSTSTVSLNVSMEDAVGTSVCSDVLTSSLGTLSCTVPNNFGNATVIAKIYKDGEFVAQGQIKLDQLPQDIYPGIYVMLGLFLLLSIAGAGLSDNPVITILSFMVGVIALFALNLVTNNGFIGSTATILWLIVAVIIVVIKGARRN